MLDRVIRKNILNCLKNLNKIPWYENSNKLSRDVSKVEATEIKMEADQWADDANILTTDMSPDVQALIAQNLKHTLGKKYLFPCIFVAFWWCIVMWPIWRSFGVRTLRTIMISGGQEFNLVAINCVSFVSIKKNSQNIKRATN